MRHVWRENATSSDHHRGVFRTDRGDRRAGAVAVRLIPPRCGRSTSSWRTEFKTWGKWAPIGQESRGTDESDHAARKSRAPCGWSGTASSCRSRMRSRRRPRPTSPPPALPPRDNAITDGGTTDNYQVSYHGQTVAHIDTWCHFFENGQMYNGVPVKDNVTKETGASRAA